MNCITPGTLSETAILSSKKTLIYESYKDKIYIKCSSNYAPVLTDMRYGGTEAQESDHYDGCRVRGIIKPYAYRITVDNGEVHAGVGWSLLSIGLVATGKRIDKLGRSIQAFNDAIQRA